MSAGEEITTAVNAPEDWRNDRGIMTCEVRGTSDDSRIRRFVGSTAMRDRCGDEIQVEAWDVKSYLKNPVFLWAHSYGELPLGKAVSVERTDKALVFDIEFAPGDANPTADQVLKLYDGGFLRAVSVGFRSKASEWIDRNEEDEAKRAKKEPDAPVGRRFTKVELLELSAVPVPANSEALMQARRKGLHVPDAQNFFYVSMPAPETRTVTYTTTTATSDNAPETVKVSVTAEAPAELAAAAAMPQVERIEDAIPLAGPSEAIPVPDGNAAPLTPDQGAALVEALRLIYEEASNG